MFRTGDRVKYVGTRVRYMGYHKDVFGKLGEIIKIDEDTGNYLIRFDVPNPHLHSGGKFSYEDDYEDYKNRCWWAGLYELQIERKNKDGCSWGYTVFMKDGSKRYFQSSKTVKEFEADIKKSNLDWDSFAWTHEIYLRFGNIIERENPTYYNNWN